MSLVIDPRQQLAPGQNVGDIIVWNGSAWVPVPGTGTSERRRIYGTRQSMWPNNNTIQSVVAGPITPFTPHSHTITNPDAVHTMQCVAYMDVLLFASCQSLVDPIINVTYTFKAGANPTETMYDASVVMRPFNNGSGSILAWDQGIQSFSSVFTVPPSGSINCVWNASGSYGAACVDIEIQELNSQGVWGYATP